ncbi:MAG: hypothetical protein AAGH78_13525 [Cyanobacteria bacterium P01_H01_bin.58]
MRCSYALWQQLAQTTAVRFVCRRLIQPRATIAPLLLTSPALLWALPAAAHHPLGDETSANAFPSFLSGLGHPFIQTGHFF